MAKKKTKHINITYEFLTFDRKNVDTILNKITEYYRKYGRSNG